MTATPIPRTAAMTVYGDLDQTEIREMPIGRSPIITTAARTDEQVDDTWRFVRSEVEAGHRGFVVCPLIDESDKLEAASAEATFEQLSGGELTGLRLGLLHGRMASADKADVMDRFRTGALDVLVATTVIEVGVDVPEATVMVILDADRFGIAQLHQLRGRVGRGSAQGHCILVAGAELTDDAERRIQALVASTDGFALAEVDLELRGEGDVLGDAQSGARSSLRLLRVVKDVDLIAAARAAAERVLEEDPALLHHPGVSAAIERRVGMTERAALAKS
jgi:ATP-dependent DNA helicase RecG